MKILALDLGDAWVGSAIADPLGISCKPYKTVPLEQLNQFLQETLPAQRITTVVVGYPKTVSAGTESDQTKKIVLQKEQLEQLFGTVNNTAITWTLWDERLSSKRASELTRGERDKEAKMKSHSIAAAFILQSYLDHLAFKRDSAQEDF
jgi:putative Holliday junction resolvase